ncbi:MAG: SRPBCC family protein [Actinomycetota bacterium]|nr:SRPBCC family protein [Actinomycetota bacterium]
MRSWSEPANAPPEEVWRLLSRPALWNRWAPHVRGAWRLGKLEIEPGRTGFVRVLGVVPVPAKVTQVTPGVSWSWRLGLMTVHHLVKPLGEGSEVTIAMEAPGPLQPALAETYGRAFPVLLRRLAREAESGTAESIA